jgi:hypothetical protein
MRNLRFVIHMDMLLNPTYGKSWIDNVNRMGEDGKELQTYTANNNNKPTETVERGSRG